MTDIRVQANHGVKHEPVPVVSGLKQYLEELLSCDVDVIRVHNNMDSFLMNQIEKDGIYLIRESTSSMAYA